MVGVGTNETQSENERWNLCLVKYHGILAALEFLTSGLPDLENSSSPPGLVNRSLFRQAAQRGHSGLTKRGRRIIECGGAVLEEAFGRGRIAFATLTIPPTSEVLDCRKRLATAYDNFRRELSRALRAGGLPFLLVGVIEAHPGRSASEGRFVPHYHLAYLGRKRYGGWVVSTGKLSRMWFRCLVSAGIIPPGSDSSACTNVQVVKKSVRKYLSKYLSKAVRVGKEEREGIPGSWHKISRELLGMIAKRTLVRSGDEAWGLLRFARTSGEAFVSKRGEVNLLDKDGEEFWVGAWSRLTNRGYSYLLEVLEVEFQPELQRS